MKSGLPCVLTVNGGSSSIRFAIYSVGRRLQRQLSGAIDRIGARGSRLTFIDAAGKSAGSQLALRARSHADAARCLLDWLEAQPQFAGVVAIGHRIVHGMRHSAPALITTKLLAELHRVAPYDPEHLPHEFALIEAFGQRRMQLPQIACFDTAFHHDMPRVAKLLPIPRRYAGKGVVRYGFHGLSYAYLMQELARIDSRAAKGRVILAHLGNGASLAAVKNGRSIDTSMGFTPAAGLLMGTRSGDIDPGVLFYLARSEGKTAAQLNRMLNHESGLRGVSATGSDVRDLLAREASDPRAAEALALFCYQAKKWIGSFAAALGGVDTLVFAGGIGEHAAPIRARICDGMEFLGIKLNAARNAKNAALISSGAVQVRVIATDEQLMIARTVARMLHLN
jgi:acetate kinase